MPAKTSQLQIRVSPDEKDALKRLAEAAGQTVSEYVLGCALPSTQLEFPRLMAELARADASAASKLLSEIGSLLEQLAPVDLSTDLPEPDPGVLSSVLLNHVAAMIEQAAHAKGVAPPTWVGGVQPLPEPHFLWSLRSLRPHQLRVTPVPFKRRNLFLDPAAAATVAA